MGFNNLKAIDVAVLLEKAVLLNGMLLHGTPENKKFAKKEWEYLEQEIINHVPSAAFETAKRELGIEQEIGSLALFDLNN